VETTAEIDLDRRDETVYHPADFELPPDGLNLRWPTIGRSGPAAQDYKGSPPSPLPAPTRSTASPWIRPNARYGIMASGKSYEDIRQALRELASHRRSRQDRPEALQDRHALAAGAEGVRHSRSGSKRSSSSRNAARSSRTRSSRSCSTGATRPPAHRRQDGRPRQAFPDLRSGTERLVARKLADRAPASIESQS